MSDLREKVKLFVEDKSYFEFDQFGDDEGKVCLSFRTRRHGNVGDDEPGEEDWEEARRITKLLKAEFPNQVKCEGETVDEWTDLIVTII